MTKLSEKTKALRDGEVWIELHPHMGDEEYGKRQCEAANALLRILFGHDTPYKFWVGSRTAYCLTTSSAGTFISLPDCGHWFKADYMSTVNWRWVDKTDLNDLPPLSADGDGMVSENVWLAFKDGSVKLGHWMHGPANRTYEGFVHAWFATDDLSDPEDAAWAQCDEDPIAWATIGPKPTFPKEALK